LLQIDPVFSRVFGGFKQMSDRVAFVEGRAFPRLALTGLALLWLSGCSSDVTRFQTSSNPFSNPFSSQTASATPSAAVPSGQVAAAPGRAVASAPPPAASPAPAPVAAQAVGGSAAGWSARGGTPVVVAQNDTLDTLSRRYGVPAAALLKANGLSSPAEVKGGMHIVVPVYNAGGRAVAATSAPDAKRVAESSAKKRSEVASNDSEERPKTKKVKDKAEERAKKAEKRGEKAADKMAEKSSEKRGEKAVDKMAERSSEKGKDKLAAKTKDRGAAEKVASAPAKTVVAKAELPAPSKGKKPAIDDTPTGNVDPKAASAKEPATAAEADASGATPEFRWPARGRIIAGFKSGGNDGINISVPPGTSVRAAESGVVVYSGDGLKGYGNLVLIKHPNGFVSAYANNGELDVKRGETVKRGQIIAKSGDTGNVNAPQLHFELRKGSTPVDPTQYLAGL
jgi:murein DD-endopeptidase MepM/ murein hydrolase activator NlpD